MKEAVNHPAHYGGADNPYEVIKVIEAWKLGFCLGNTIKYIGRAGNKGSALEDLKKAAWYLNHQIEKIEVSEIKEALRLQINGDGNGTVEISPRLGPRLRSPGGLDGQRSVYRPERTSVIRRRLAKRRGRGKG